MTTKKTFILPSLLIIIIVGVLSTGFVVADVTSINVENPNGGEFWRGTQEIEWSVTLDEGGESASTEYDIAYSPDSGTNWVNVEQGIARGQRIWSWNTVSYDESSNALIRVKDFFTGVIGLSNIFEVDNTPPSAISNLAATAVANGNIQLKWTATGDNDGIGKATSYIVKYSTSDITSEADFNAATTYSQSWPPKLSEESETEILTGFTNDKTYYFAIEAVDNADNEGDLSNIQSAISDATDPTVILTYSDSDEIVKTSDTLTITADFSEAVQDSSTPQITIDYQGTCDDLSVTDMTKVNDRQYTYSVTVPSDVACDGTAIVTITAKDIAGNDVSTITNNDFLMDNTAPTVELTYSANPAKAGEMTITATYSEAIVGTPAISIDQPGTTDMITQAMSGGATVWTYSYTVNTATGDTYIDGTATVSLSAIADVAGNNVRVAPTEDTFVIDTTPPTSSITSPLTNDVVKDASGSVSLEFNSAGGSVCEYSIDGGTSYTNLGGCTSPQTITLADGRQTITLNVTDSAGNSAESTAVSFVVDKDNTLDVPRDFATIQSAIIKATTGDTINVAAGLYEEAITINKPLILKGATHGVNKNGYTVPVNYAWNSNLESVIQNPDSNDIATVVDIVSDDVIFEGFIVQSLNRPTNNWGNLLRLDASTGNAHDGDVIDDTLDNIIIRNNIIGPNTNIDSQDGTMGRMGLYFASPNYPDDERGITNTLVTGNKIFDSKGNGNNIFVWGSAESYNSPSRANYTGTIIEDNEIYGSHRSGIEISGGADGLTIRNNKIYNNSGLIGDDPILKYGNGIIIIRMGSDKASSTAHGSSNIEISSNEIYNNEKNAIYLGPINENYQITNNDIHNNGWDALRIDLEETYHGGDNPVYDKISEINLSNNLIVDNIEYGARVIGTPTNGFELDAEINYWGASSGPNGEGNGAGDAVSTNVGFEPWYIDAGMTILSSEVNLDVIYVDDGYTDNTACDSAGYVWNLNCFDKIQEGIDAVNENGIVNVAAGTYVERLTIDKPLILNGSTSDVIKKGYVVPADYAYDSSVETIIQEPDGESVGSVVTITSNNVILKGFVIENLKAFTGSTYSNSHLIYVIPSEIITNLQILNNVVGPNTNVDTQDGTKGRFGIYLSAHNYDLGCTVTGNKVLDALGNGNGIMVWGTDDTGGDGGDLTGTVISENEITGNHRTGIELSGGIAHLEISHNDIHANGAYSTDDKDNQKYGNGIAMIRDGSDFGEDAKYINDIIIKNNNISNNEKSGIYMGPRNKDINITGNNIYNNGIFDSYKDWNGIIVDLTEVYDGREIANAEYDFATNIDANENKIYGNGLYGVRVIGIPTNDFELNATFSYWGAPNGPSGVGSGDGDAISVNVLYEPWAWNIDMKVDTTAPTIEITNPDDSAAQSKTITASVSDGTLTMFINTIGVDTCNSGLNFVAYSSTTFSSEADNTKTVCYKAVDTAGNINYSVSDAIAGIDTTAPTTTDNSDINWHADDQTVTLDPQDTGGSGIVNTHYCIYNEGESECALFTEGISVSVTCSADSVCKQIVRYYSVDTAGNEETADNSKVIKIDKQAPGINDVTGNATIEVDDSKEISATVTDSGSGIKTEGVVLHYNNGTNDYDLIMIAEGNTYTATIPAQSSSGAITYYITADDNVDNSATSSTYTITVHDLIWDLTSNWNLVSVPKALATEDKSTLLGNTVWYYDTTDSGEPWKTPTTIEPGVGYWVDNSALASLGLDYAEISGGLWIPPMITLQPGWNLIGHMCTADQNLINIPSLRVDSTHQLFVLNYDEEQEKFGVCSLQDTGWECDSVFGDAKLKTGEGYWTFSDTTVPYTNICN